MAQHAFWIIVDGQTPSSFRSRHREDLLPTLNQLKRTQPQVVLMWFERGRLWASPTEAREALIVRRKAPTGRPRDWRPGGEHKDPRAKYAITRDEKRARFKTRLFRDRREGDATPDVAGKPADSARKPADVAPKPTTAVPAMRPDRPPYRPARQDRPPGYHSPSRPPGARPPFRPPGARPPARPFARPPARPSGSGRPPAGRAPYEPKRESSAKPSAFGDRPWRPKKPWRPGKPWRPAKPNGGDGK